MPQVPTASVPSVMPSGDSGLPYSSGAGATPDAFGASIGQAEQGLGRQIEVTGDMLAKHALQRQEEINVASAEQHFLSASIELGNLQEKYKSLEGLNREAALPKFMDDASSIRDKYRDMAGNGDVAKKFDQLFTRQLSYSVREAGGLAGQATRQAARDTSAAVQANSLSEIAKNSQNDKAFLSQTQIGLESMRRGADYTGASPEVRQNKDEAFVSQAWATRLQSMAIDQPLRARALFEKNKASMDGLTQFKLEPLINQAIITKGVPVASDRIIQELGTGAMEDRLKRLEGYSEKPYADYKQTSSGYGTKAQPGDENIPPEQRQAVYTARMRNELAAAYTIVDNFAPGLPKGARDALADLTYNAGAQWTTAGLGKAVRTGDMETAKARLQEYNKAGGEVNPTLVARRAEELTWWNTDQSQANSDPMTMMSKSLDRAREEAAKVFPDNPVFQSKYLDTLQSRLSSDLGIMQRTARDIQTTSMNQIQKEILADPANPITSLDKLSPQAQQLYNGLPYGGQKLVDAALKTAATADVPLTNQRQDRYNTLYGMSRANPDQFIAANIDNEDLPRAQKASLLKMQADKKALIAKGAQMGPAMSGMQGYLNDAGIRKSFTDKTANEEYNKFQGVFEQSLNAFEQEKKRPPTEKETREIGQGLLKDIVTTTHWYGDSKSKDYQLRANPVKVNSIEEARALLPGVTFTLDGETRTRK